MFLVCHVPSSDPYVVVVNVGKGAMPTVVQERCKNEVFNILETDYSSVSSPQRHSDAVGEYSHTHAVVVACVQSV